MVLIQLKSTVMQQSIVMNENVLHQIKNTFENPSFFEIKELVLQSRMIHTITSYATANHTAMCRLVNLFRDKKQN